MLKNSNSPTQRTIFIKEFANWSNDLKYVATVLANTDIPHLRSGICLAIGGISSPNQETKDAWRPILERWYSTCSTGGTHSAAGWAIHQWNLDLPEIEESKSPPDERGWWHTNGLRFARITRGTVRSDDGPVVINEDFWMSDCEITVGLFKQFLDDEQYHREHPGMKPDGADLRFFLNYGGDNSLPVEKSNWYDSVMFCNWLSWRLDLEPCYEIRKMEPPKPDIGQPQEQAPNTIGIPVLYEPYRVSCRQDECGIRLPTAAEWEYACRNDRDSL